VVMIPQQKAPNNGMMPTPRVWPLLVCRLAWVSRF
jgi:hypothetical protein